MMTDKIQDSLDNLSGVRGISPSNKERDQKQRSIMYALRQKFITALSKLQSPETREIALNEIRRIIDQYREPEHIRMYMSLMKSLKIQGTSSSTKQHEILVFSIMAELLKDRLADPIDKPPSSVKTTFRIIEIVHQYFIDSTNTVQQACARVLIDLGRYVLGAQNPSVKNIDAETVINLLFSPLASILKSGVDKASQSTASVCINQMIQYWKRNSANPLYQNILQKISPEMLNVILRLNCQYHEIFMAVSAFIDIYGLAFFRNKIIQFVSKILGVINRINSKNSKETSNNFNSYMSKVHVCVLLQKIGDYLRGDPELKNRLDELDVMTALQRASRNRVIQVQTAAQRALRVWKGQVISTIKSASPRKDRIMSLEDARNNMKKNRSRSRQQKMKIQNQLNYMQEDLNKLVKGGWGPRNRANQYVKKNSGVGGGYSAKMDHSPSPQGNNNKSHKEHIQQLRQFIKKSAEEHGKKDKFAFYPVKQSSDVKGAEKPQQKSIQNKQNKNIKYKMKGNGQKLDEDFDFELQQDGGDQGAIIPDDSLGNPYANNQYMDEIDPEEARDLIQNKERYDQSLSDLEEEIQKVSQMKQQQAKNKQKQNDMQKQGRPKVQQIRISEKNKQQYENDKDFRQQNWPINIVSKEKDTLQVDNTKNLKNMYQFDDGENMQYSGNLDNMSMNMDGLLNQSDFDILGDKKEGLFNQSPQNMGDYTENAQKYIDSLNFSESGKKNISKANSEKNQFTLGAPQIDIKKMTKFNSYMQDAQIQQQRQILDQSQYIQSRQANMNYLKPSELRVHNKPKISKIYQDAVQHQRMINQQTSEQHQKSEIYQEMIRNPPKALHPYKFDKSFSLNPIKSAGNEEEEDSHGEGQECQAENITDIWENVLELIDQGQINEAYQNVFRMDDPIYLLRLMLMTQTPLAKLTPANTCKLWQKFLQIYQHRFIDNIFVQMFSQSMRLSKGKGLKNTLSIQETNELMVELYELSGRTKGKLSFGAANLYNEIDQSIHGNRQ